MTLEGLRGQLPTAKQFKDFVSTNGQDALGKAVNGTLIIAGGCLAVQGASLLAGAAGASTVASAILPSCCSCAAVETLSGMALTYLPGMPEAAVAGGKIALGLGLVFAKELKAGLSGKDVTTTKTGEFLGNMALDKATSVVTAVGANALLNSGVAVAGFKCSFTAASESTLRGLVSNVPYFGSGLSGSVVSELTAGAMTFQKGTVDLASRALTALKGIGTSPKGKTD